MPATSEIETRHERDALPHVRVDDEMSRTSEKARLRRMLAPRSSGIVYALFALCAALSLLSSAQGRPVYLSDINVQNILSQSALLTILAIFTTVVLISGNFDLSVASTAALGGTVALLVVDSHGVWLATGAALLTGMVVGFVNGFLVQKLGINAFIVTLGTMTAVRGLQEVVVKGQTVLSDDTTYNAVYSAYWAFPRLLAIGVGVALISAGLFAASRRSHLSGRMVDLLTIGLPGLLVLVVAMGRPGLLTQGLPVWIMFGLSLVTASVLRFTVVGRNVYAVGANSEAARLSGISVDRYKMGAFVLNGLFAAAVGVLYVGQFNSIDARGLSGYELTAITAAILGGTSLFGGAGYVAKTVVGAILLFTLTNGFDVLNIGANYQSLVQGIVLIGAASLYTVSSPHGRQSLLARLKTGRK